jgi:hypothetical protein
MENILDKSCRENQNTNFMFNNFFPKMSKNMVEPEMQQMTVRRRVECWISKATRAHSRAPTHTHTRTHTHIYKLTIPHNHTRMLVATTALSWLKQAFPDMGRTQQEVGVWMAEKM